MQQPSQRRRRRRSERLAAEPAGAQPPESGPAAEGGPEARATRASERERWLGFFQERQQELARHDRLAALVLLGAQAAALWRLHSLHDFQPWQLVYSSLVSSMLLTIAVVSGTQEWLPKRRPYLAAVRLATVLSPVVQLRVPFTFKDERGLRGTLLASTYLLYADQCILMAFLHIAFPLDGWLGIAVQLASTASTSWHSTAVCVFQHLASLGTGPLLPPFLHLQRSKKLCVHSAAALQAIVGWLAPQALLVCSRAKHEVRYAERHGLPATDSRLLQARFVRDSEERKLSLASCPGACECFQPCMLFKR